jgi:hypothetical protein
VNPCKTAMSNEVVRPTGLSRVERYIRIKSVRLDAEIINLLYPISCGDAE